ncbi:MAG: hypothetical protein EOR43_28845 [Mesorhizobium sp.]|uniref:hypothetical protein n=1 Tax=Mesorhizobium sp. TaxID=1871066 RepID=UPI000FE2E980|nr:hypothetical protein [Mesorhizobium sp.]RWK17054.1 MAG: hypothetical protein EOR43_28845 [Mesorhizobium sp.]RWK27361.1 MAG: hypothetical protein EOR44_27825 [Mesorhizobium sp.]
MASFLKKSAAEPFRVPDLGEVDAEFAKLEDQNRDLNSKKSATDRELAALREDLADVRGPTLPAGVAALLGEETDSVTGKRQRAAELSKLSSDLGTAIDIVGRRLRERRDIAKRPLISAVRGEYDRRTAAVVDALDAAREPLRAIEELRLDFEAHDIAGHFEWPNSNLSHFASVFAGSARKGA